VTTTDTTDNRPPDSKSPPYCGSSRLQDEKDREVMQFLLIVASKNYDERFAHDRVACVRLMCVCTPCGHSRRQRYACSISYSSGSVVRLHCDGYHILHWARGFKSWTLPPKDDLWGLHKRWAFSMSHAPCQLLFQQQRQSIGHEHVAGGWQQPRTSAAWRNKMLRARWQANWKSTQGSLPSWEHS
jgi:hypothetical protein